MELEQIQRFVETEFSKQRIREKVIKEIKGSNLINELTEKIIEYRYKEYSYESKNKRISNLKEGARDIAIDIIVAILTIKRSLVPFQSIVGILVDKLSYENKLDAIKTASELLAVCEGNLFTIYHSSDASNDTGTLAIEPHFQVSTKVRQFIDSTRYLPPMICKPKDWVSNKDGGHIVNKDHIILGSMNRHGENQNYEAINILQDIAWELNESILELEEEPSKPLDTKEKRDSFNGLQKTSEDIYDYLSSTGNEFYFVWKYDFRGRFYSQGYEVNIQGNSYRRAMLQFKNKVLITDDIIV